MSAVREPACAAHPCLVRAVGALRGWTQPRTGDRVADLSGGEAAAQAVHQAHAAVVRDPGMQHQAGPGAEPDEAEERHPAAGAALAYEQADAVIGSACERTIARHRQWAQRLVADTMLEASELVAELTPFAELPIVRVGGGGRAELRHYLTALCAARRAASGGGAGLSVIGWVHLRYVVVRARNPVAIPLNLVLRCRLRFDTS